MKRLALALLLFVPVASAHEIGTTQVRALFGSDHRYRIEITTAPRGLLDKLDAAAHRPREASSIAAKELQRRLRQLAPEIAAHARVRFDGRVIQPAVDVSGDDTAVTVCLTGPIPADVRTFTWSFDLIYSTYALVLRDASGSPQTQWIEGSDSSAAFALAQEVVPQPISAVLLQYLALGFTHIVPRGLDHILFVLGLFLLTTKLRPLLQQITAFTIAHSITLALTVYGAFSVSPRFVEPLIALSIAYVAIENLTTTELKPWRVAIVFAFGLLHGMGFAGALRALGLPRSQFAPALVAFNLGVEGGQLAVVATAFALFAAWHRAKPWYRNRLVIPASAAIAAAGVFWTVQRLMP